MAIEVKTFCPSTKPTIMVCYPVTEQTGLLAANVTFSKAQSFQKRKWISFDTMRNHETKQNRRQDKTIWCKTKSQTQDIYKLGFILFLQSNCMKRQK